LIDVAPLSTPCDQKNESREELKRGVAARRATLPVGGHHSNIHLYNDSSLFGPGSAGDVLSNVLPNCYRSLIPTRARAENKQRRVNVTMEINGNPFVSARFICVTGRKLLL